METVKTHELNRPYIAIGLLLIAIGVILPLLINVEYFKVYDTLYLAVRNEEQVTVIYAAFKLVILNSVRCLPDYLGAFFISESIRSVKNIRHPIAMLLIRYGVVILIIPVIYSLIHAIYGIHYDFGVPAILLILMLVMMEKADLSFINLSKKVLMLMLLVVSVQFLDVMPALRDLPFGRGETSVDIKLIADFLGADQFLQHFATLLFFLLLFCAMLLCKLIIDENNLRSMNEIQEQNARLKTAQRVRALEERNLLELRQLVHDLKTPITSAQTLIGVAKMGIADGRTESTLDCLGRVEKSMDTMSTMISEILYEDFRKTIPMAHFFSILLAQLSDMPYAPLIQPICQIPNHTIHVNEIRLLRVMANLIENAYHAQGAEKSPILVGCCSSSDISGKPICIYVEDNGVGIKEDALNSIWDCGFSTRESHGLGLNFVRQVVQANSGEIRIHSRLGEGTTVSIYLPESEGKDETEFAANSMH